MKLKVPNSKKKVDLQEGSKACHFRLLIPPSLPTQTKKSYNCSIQQGKTGRCSMPSLQVRDVAKQYQQQEDSLHEAQLFQM